MYVNRIVTPSSSKFSACSHFTWSLYEGGICYLKKGQISESNAQAKAPGYFVCGYIRNRAGGISGGVKGTFWAEKSDSGGCQMPQGDYAVTDALALGQGDALGNLKWRQGLCGQVLRVDCGNGPVDAVVASTCNLNSNSCGVDMIGKTWRQVTGNASPGVVDCSVSLTNRNPINENAPVCYYRPNSEFNNDYYAILGVFNTGGRVSSFAQVSGVSGNRNNDGYFEFNGSGQPIMNKNAHVVFSYEDGSSTAFSLWDCKNGGQTHIFQ